MQCDEAKGATHLREFSLKKKLSGASREFFYYEFFRSLSFHGTTSINFTFSFPTPCSERKGRCMIKGDRNGGQLHEGKMYSEREMRREVLKIA